MAFLTVIFAPDGPVAPCVRVLSAVRCFWAARESLRPGWLAADILLVAQQPTAPVDLPLRSTEFDNFA